MRSGSTKKNNGRIKSLYKGFYFGGKFRGYAPISEGTPTIFLVLALHKNQVVLGAFSTSPHCTLHNGLNTA